MHLAIYVRK